MAEIEISSVLLALKSIKDSPHVLLSFRESISRLESGIRQLQDIVPYLVFGGNQSAGKTSTIQWLTGKTESQSILCSGEGAVTKFVTEFAYRPGVGEVTYEVLAPPNYDHFIYVSPEDVDAWKTGFDEWMASFAVNDEDQFYAGTALRITTPDLANITITDNPGLQTGRVTDRLMKDIYGPQLGKDSSILVSVIKANIDARTDSYLGVMRELPGRIEAVAKGMVILTHVDQATPYQLETWYEVLEAAGCRSIFISSQHTTEEVIRQKTQRPVIYDKSTIFSKITDRLNEEVMKKRDTILATAVPLVNSLNELRVEMLGNHPEYNSAEVATIHTRQMMNLSSRIKEWVAEFRSTIAKMIQYPTDKLPVDGLIPENCRVRFPPNKETRQRLVAGKASVVKAHIVKALQTIGKKIETVLRESFSSDAPLLASCEVKEKIRQSVVNTMWAQIEELKRDELPLLDLEPDSILLEEAIKHETEFILDIGRMLNKNPNNAMFAFRNAMAEYYKRLFRSALKSIEDTVERKVVRIVGTVSQSITDSVIDPNTIAQFATESEVSSNIRKCVDCIDQYLIRLQAQHR